MGAEIIGSCGGRTEEEPSGTVLSLFALFHLLIEYVYAHMSHGTHVEIRVQFVGFLLPCGSQGLKSSRQAWQKALF